MLQACAIDPKLVARSPIFLAWAKPTICEADAMDLPQLSLQELDQNCLVLQVIPNL